MAGQVDERMIMQQVQAEAENAYIQELFTSVREKCIDKCISRPGSSLSSSEQTCLARCCDRYIEATKVVSGVILKRGAQGAEMH
eukprot:CAMPEP_0114250006 /NCGR_PEP_ID=MMETSP0058-20121206/14464_1 /TAXON_ID=36894 /ORGANISM="Pyramimonas parkeae, CCMP726" /LENGTH=83 /DNA_ID=CAMNT_0001363627 /DNA_START=48 /DNA_END=299 /DNA_ORIENTATION=+